MIKNIRSQSKTVKDPSEAQRNIKHDIKVTKEKNKTEDLKRERNKIINTLHKEIEKEERKKLNEKIEEIEKCKHDSNRMFQVIRQLLPKERKKILVHTENGVTASEKKKIVIVTNHFKEVFQRRREDEIKDIVPTEMKEPFKEVEIRKSVSRLKDNMSTGINDISAEMIKYSPKIVYQRIADIFNEVTKIGNMPDEVIEGVMVPLPKPGNPEGPPANLRPIMLLSILWKINAICMINRIQEKSENRIPLSQAEYRAGRSTTEHVFTCKILAEKAITSECYETTILLLDMSKAFDTVKRNNLMDYLKKY